MGMTFRKLTYSFVAALLMAHPSVIYASKITAGWIEYAVLFPFEKKMKAKLDTGAKTTSINAVHLETFERDGEEIAKFDITNGDGHTMSIESPITRIAKVKRHATATQIRPVIELDICIGSVRKKVEVSLIDRSRFKYQLLIGRNFLSGDILVDSAETFTVEKECSD